MALTKADFLAFRDKFTPTTVKLVVIAESPPKNQTYFYNPAGRVTEWLFSALMEQLSHTPTTKEDGLREFQRRGWILADATYEPIDGLGTQKKKRNAIIVRDYPLLVATLELLSPDKCVPIILIKANVCELLDSRLTADGFNVLNGGVRVAFPAFGQQPKFRAQFTSLRKAARL